MEMMILPLKRFADFSGRSRRREYWMFALFQAILYGVAFVLMIAGSAGDGGGSFVGGSLFLLLALGLLIPNFALQVRRFHDLDKSGWMTLLGLIPYVGGIVLLVFNLMDGTPGPNEYGPDPKRRGEAAVFE